MHKSGSCKSIVNVNIEIQRLIQLLCQRQSLQKPRKSDLSRGKFGSYDSFTDYRFLLLRDVTASNNVKLVDKRSYGED